ncbi:F-box domain-containing protein [Meloidogyne graminicola]|uniref:F-box domain-containing protein n=1 Tax=Meloidogyne graminicola TaxID=189291 RepID=A0A8S9ZTU7_9BILA|nr:F-box domain-containing protein [Meloidogyne graminicola]
MEYFPIESLPPEIQLKILKNLNFDELFNVKQTNRYFCDFIDNYKESFGPKKFQELFLTLFKDVKNMKKLKRKSIDFPLSNRVQEKCLSVLDEEMPVFTLITQVSHIKPSKPLLIFNEDPWFVPEEDKKKKCLSLPSRPTKIEEFKIVRYWLNQILLTDFETFNFDCFIFNPEMINLLFDSEEIEEFKFRCQEACFSFPNRNFNAWKFTLDNLVVSKCLTINFKSINTSRWENNMILNLLLNEGSKFSVITLVDLYYDQTALYNNFITVRNMELILLIF